MFFYFFLISLIAEIKTIDQEDPGNCKPVQTEWSEGNTKYVALEYKNELFAYPICRSGSKVKVRCIDGRWEKPLPRCEKIATEHCESLVTRENVVKNCSDGSPSVGTECTFRCVNSRYQLTGSVKRRCLENLQWSGATSQCIPIAGKGVRKHRGPTKKPRIKKPSLTSTMVGVNLCDKNNGGCQHLCKYTGKKVVCSCYEGFQQSNKECIDIDECATNNGGCSGTCTNLLGSYQCSCPEGYRLDNDKKTCVDINECLERQYNCVGQQRCRNTIGSYECSCEQGYTLKYNYYCEDIDECVTSNGGCSDKCTNSLGSYYCSCPAGYHLDIDRKNCVDIDECLERQHHCSQTCHNTIGSYTCSCREGFTLYYDYHCEDINECALNNGGCTDACYNLPGSYVCSCSPGFRLDVNGARCIDVDECDERRHNCNQKCLNTIGSYTCSCEDGFRLNYINQCEDIDECKFNNGDCSDNCVNSLGSYYCSCAKGYSLDLDGKHCNDIDECLRKEDNQCNQKCTNTRGSYYCSCEPGYVLKNKYECEGCRKNSYKSSQDESCVECPPNSVTDSEAKTSITDCICLPGFDGDPSFNSPCYDIDECLENNFGCSDTCVNTPGGVFCSCPIGLKLKGDNKTCEDINECSLKNGGCQMLCNNSVGSFSCSCSAGYTLSEDKYSCIDINECAKNNGGCSAICNNFPGGYYCSCPEDYQLDVEGRTCVVIRCPSVAVPHHSTLRCLPKSSPSLLKDKQILKSNDENSSNPLYFTVGTTCRVKCNRGYALKSSHSTIRCLSNGRWNESTPQCVVSHCAPLEIPDNGDIYPPVCTEGPISVQQKCYVTCKPGYHISGQQKELKCKNNLTWTINTPSCEPDNIVPFISCPNDITVDLLLNESYANVTIPRPHTNMEDFEVSPAWINTEEANSFPGGKTDVRFRVRTSTVNTTTECVMTVNVVDKEPPVFLQCPKSFSVDGVSSSGVSVSWDDPYAVDNVGIQSVSTNLEPNSTLTAGIHYVEYTARDEAGNTAQCLFQIHLTSTYCGYLSDPENGKANCMDWFMGRLCRPSCEPGFERNSNESRFFACGASGIWNPSDSISPCLEVADETV